MHGQSRDETVVESAVHMNHLTGREGVWLARGTGRVVYLGR